MTERLARARHLLEDAILEVDRAVQERDGDPRGENEILTAWAVVYSFHRVEDDGGPDSTQLAEIRSDGLSYWQVGGLFSAAASRAFDEPWREDE